MVRRSLCALVGLLLTACFAPAAPAATASTWLSQQAGSNDFDGSTGEWSFYADLTYTLSIAPMGGQRQYTFAAGSAALTMTGGSGYIDVPIGRKQKLEIYTSGGTYQSDRWSWIPLGLSTSTSWPGSVSNTRARRLQ
jgi:hypothetical protein